jgi:sarcosine oxidase delta subunit
MTLKVIRPNCGPRYSTEFWFGGELPPPAAPDTPNADPAGGLRTRLVADQPLRRAGRTMVSPRGCRRWLIAERDTRTNEFHGRG